MKINTKNQHTNKEETIASICGFLAIMLSISVVGLNVYRQNKKIEQVEIKVEQQTDEIKEVQQEVKEVKQEVQEVKKEVQIKYAYMNGNWSEAQLKVRIETEKRIREIAGDYKYVDYLVKLCDCESMLGLKLKNEQGNYPVGSVDEGYFQWNSHWQKDINNRCKYNLECEVKEVIKKIDAGGQGIWVCDKYVKGTDNFR